MTVQELIEHLQQFDPNLQVIQGDCDAYLLDVYECKTETLTDGNILATGAHLVDEKEGRRLRRFYNKVDKSVRFPAVKL